MGPHSLRIHEARLARQTSTSDRQETHHEQDFTTHRCTRRRGIRHAGDCPTQAPAPVLALQPRLRQSPPRARVAWDRARRAADPASGCVADRFSRKLVHPEQCKARPEARQKMLDACKDKTGPKHKQCMQEQMQKTDCSQTANPQQCEARKQAYTTVKDQTGAELKSCMKAKMPPVDCSKAADPTRCARSGKSAPRPAYSPHSAAARRTPAAGSRHSVLIPRRLRRCEQHARLPACVQKPTCTLAPDEGRSSVW